MPGTRTLALLSALAIAPLPDGAWAQATPTQADRDCPGPGCPPAVAATPAVSAIRPNRAPAADEILSLFSGAPLRAVCIGTAEACATQTNAPATPAVQLLLTFELDSARLTPEARDTLAIVAGVLRHDALRDERFEIAGHTDARGDAGYNRALSKARAQSVARLLSDLGVSNDRLSVVGYGESRPLSADRYAPVNRRVEIAMIGPRATGTGPATLIAGDPDPWDGTRGGGSGGGGSGGGGAGGGGAGGWGGGW